MKKNMFMKKTFSLFISAVMLFSTASCGKKDEGNVTLEWWYRGNGMQADTMLVQDKLNEMLKNYEGMENVTVHLNCATASDYQTQVTLAMSGGKQIDILNTVNLSFDDMCKDEYLLPLDEFIDSADTLKNTLPDWLWELGKYEDKTYMVPNYQNAAARQYIIFPKAYADAFSKFEEMKMILKNEDSTVAEIAGILEEYLLAVRDAYPNEEKYLNPIGRFYAMSNVLSPVHDSFSWGYAYYPKTNSAENMLTTPWAKEAFKYTAEWYEKGYIHPDILTKTITDFEQQNMMNPTSFVYSTNSGFLDEEEYSKTLSESYGFDVVAIALKDTFYQGYTWASGGNCVTVTCKHPDKAMRLIELMNTEEGKELYNLMVYGIEGKHYEKIDDNHIKTFEYDTTQGGVSTSYAAMKWIIGNSYNAYINQGGSEELDKLSKEINESDKLVKSPLMGFHSNTDNIKSNLDQLSAIVTEYSNTLSFGIMGSKWEEKYNEYEEKIKLAGHEDVINEYNAQIGEFLKNK